MAQDAYYAKAVAWAVEQGITKGTSADTFSPDKTCTRGESVTFLYRSAGEDVPAKSAFSDVAADSYCGAAVTWASDNGVTGGVGNGKFAPNAQCTRGQIVTFLFRAEKAPQNP